MRQELISMLSAYPLTLKWMQDIENLPCGAIIVHNFEREVVLEGPKANDYLIPFFDFTEVELASGFNGDGKEMIARATRKGDHYLKGRQLFPALHVANVATESRAGELVFGGSSQPISSQGRAVVDICEGKRPQPLDPIRVPALYEGFMWVASDEELEKELYAYSPMRDNDAVLNILARPRFRKGYIIKIKYAKDIPQVAMRAPTVVDSKGLPLWRKCRTPNNWGRTVAMHKDFEDGIAEAVHAVPCVLPVGTTLEIAGICKQDRHVDVESLCPDLLQKTMRHSPL